ncbi:hypothetical protein A0H81_14746 [Grifola frondosa]|uniref:Uncharacterized protein n=1 Tax=Grifola frondosa TaxID=5627 RepID=A0A1C7LKN4_GRIFR|nr:hypothetical protein A0H81_14746 [Grifola frondosa]
MTVPREARQDTFYHVNSTSSSVPITPHVRVVRHLASTPPACGYHMPRGSADENKYLRLRPLGNCTNYAERTYADGSARVDAIRMLLQQPRTKVGLIFRSLMMHHAFLSHATTSQRSLSQNAAELRYATCAQASPARAARPLENARRIRGVHIECAWRVRTRRDGDLTPSRRGDICCAR